MHPCDTFIWTDGKLQCACRFELYKERVWMQVGEGGVNEQMKLFPTAGIPWEVR